MEVETERPFLDQNHRKNLLNCFPGRQQSSCLSTTNHLAWWLRKHRHAERRSSPPEQADCRMWYGTDRPGYLCRLKIRRLSPGRCIKWQKSRTWLKLWDRA